MKTKAAVTLAIVLSLSVCALAPSAVGRAQPRAADSGDITKLFPRAVARVRSNNQFSRAIVLEAYGQPAGKLPVKSADEIVRWQFVFANAGSRSQYASVTINYSRASGLARPVGHRLPYLEDNEIRQAPRMTLAGAIRRLNDAGFDDGFYNVVLRDPVGPNETPPFYIFTLTGNRYAAVNTVTGKVERF